MVRPSSIGIVAYDGVQMSAVLGLEDVFIIANRHDLVSDKPKLSVEKLGPDSLPDGLFDAVILPPNLSGARGAQDTGTHSFLTKQHAQGSTICSACAGVFWLGHAGLLSGRTVTTHWALEQEFTRSFPDSHLQSEHLLIDDGDIVTAGGMMAWVDLGLFLVDRHLGPEVASHTARNLLVDLRGREQRNYRSFRPDLAHGYPAILRLQHWMEGNCNSDLSIPVLAHQSGYSERTFLRKFKAATGLLPNTYIQELRVEKARGMLEHTRNSVSQIGWDVGYQDVSAFGRVFKSITGLTPGDYRNRFSVLNDR